MFTGLIKELGTVTKIESNQEGHRFTINCPKLINEIKIDDSVSINGVCLTATDILPNGFVAQAVHLTLTKTNLGQLNNGSKVNLELALKLSDRLGGHLVQGHVNDCAKLIELKNQGENYEIWFDVPPTQLKYIIKEGSVTLDGISLTVADIQDNKMLVTIIPHTWENTVLRYKKVGDLVNLEVDMMAKYLENFMKHQVGIHANI